MEASIVVAVPVVGVFMFPAGASAIVMRASSPLLPQRLCRSFIALSHHVPHPQTTHESSHNGAFTAVEHPEERIGSGRGHVRPSSSPLLLPSGMITVTLLLLPSRAQRLLLPRMAVAMRDRHRPACSGGGS